MSKRLGASALALVVFLVVAPAAAAPVKTKAVIESITRTALPGNDTWIGNGKVTAPDDACLNKREVTIYGQLGPPFNTDNSIMQVVETNKQGRWSATWETRSGPGTGQGDIEEASTGVHHIGVEKLTKKRLKCSAATSKNYTVPSP